MLKNWFTKNSKSTQPIMQRLLRHHLGTLVFKPEISSQHPYVNSIQDTKNRGMHTMKLPRYVLAQI